MPGPLALVESLEGHVDLVAVWHLEVVVPHHDAVPVPPGVVLFVPDGQFASDIHPAVPWPYGQVPVDISKDIPTLCFAVVLLREGVVFGGGVPLPLELEARVRGRHLQVGEVPREIRDAYVEASRVLGGGHFPNIVIELEGHYAGPIEFEVVVVNPVVVPVGGVVEVDPDLGLAVMLLQGDVPPQAAP